MPVENRCRWTLQFSMAVQIRRLHSTRVHLTNPSVLRLSLRNCGRRILRLISKGTVNGILRPLINGEFTFVFGTLDQGYWPDGIYTPPNREAMVYDLHFLKSLGFNMLRSKSSRPSSTGLATKLVFWSFKTCPPPDHYSRENCQTAMIKPFCQTLPSRRNLIDSWSYL